MAGKLPNEGVEIGGVVEAVVVAVEGESDDSEDEDLPEIHAGATGGFFVSGLDAFKDGEDFAIYFRGDEDPLQSGGGGRKFVAGLGGEFDFFDGDGSESKLNVE
ncbi:MAG: hypothetical protein ACJAQT_002768 [Akkermansiaceae bacterium]